jgi:hypothetical protein
VQIENHRERPRPFRNVRDGGVDVGSGGNQQEILEREEKVALVPFLMAGRAR